MKKQSIHSSNGMDTTKLPVKTYTAKDFAWVKWTPKDIQALSEKTLLTLKKDYEVIKKISKEKRTFENTVEAIEMAGRECSKNLAFAHLLQEVSPQKEIREAVKKMMDIYSPQVIEISYDEGVYFALKEYLAKKESFKGERKILVDDMVRGYRRMGFDLSLSVRNKLKKNKTILSKLKREFHKNINDYKDHITLTAKEAEGLSGIYLSGLKKDKKGNFLVSLEYPDLIPFLENSPNDKKRKELTDKNSRKGGVKNLEIIEKIITLRHTNAKLLGYKNHAEYAIEPRMAKKPEIVMSFLNGLIMKLSKAAKKELSDLDKFKREYTKNKKAKFTYFDSFYAEQMKKRQFNVDNEKVREYFPFQTVKEGMFSIYQKLFGVTFNRVAFKTWHPDVEVYEIKEKGKTIAYFMMDLFPREGKYGHAMAVNLIDGHVEKISNKEIYIAPLACLVTNFSKSTKENPSLMSHGEVETFFHEFGHVMHMVLTKSFYESQAGANVAWDYVEAPSQMLENWTWDKSVLKIISGHYKNKKEKLPDQIIANMKKAKNFLVSRHYTRQMLISIFDMQVNLKEPKQKLNLIYRKLTKKMMGIDGSANTLFPAGFGHIAGGYDAGFYSYAWAQVYAQDMFTRFQKEGVLNPKTGRDYRKWILEKGSSMEEMDLIKGFLGRAPNNKAFLKDIGVLK